MYRKALDIAVKEIDPKLTGMLGPKLKKLAQAGRLTNDISDWADQVRVLGNEAAHDGMINISNEPQDIGFTAVVFANKNIDLLERPQQLMLIWEASKPRQPKTRNRKFDNPPSPEQLFTKTI